MNIEEKIIEYILNKYEKIKINSKEIKKGDIFLALKGKNFHGNKYIDESIKNGAKYCITDKKTKSKNKNILIIKNTLFFLEKIAKIKRSYYKGNIIGVTGSAGKTTLKENLSFFLKKNFKISKSIKSYNNLLGVLISILNLNLKSKYAIFEIGTNNFGEIAKLTFLIKPKQIFITNIQSTHLMNFKNKKNIAIEKSNIFFKKYNSESKILYLINQSSEEELINKYAIKEKIKVIKVGERYSKIYLKTVERKKNYFLLLFFLKNKFYTLKTKHYFSHQIKNLLFCLCFFVENKIDTKVIFKYYDRLPAVEGRGKIHNLTINNSKIKFIDETYNANPDTMIQCIKYFDEIKYNKYEKILILGDMNELGNQSIHLHLKIIEFLSNYKFHNVILCGKFFKSAVNKLKKNNMNYIILTSKKNLYNHVNKYFHKKAIIMAKCSNNTEVNRFAKKLIKLGDK